MTNAIASAARSFHTQDGIYFVRSFGGWVEVHQDGTFLFSFDPATWASVVTFVSARNSGERYRAALRFHQGRDHGICNDNIVEIHAPEVNLAAALEVAAAHFRFSAEVERQAGRQESRGNASIFDKRADECLAAIAAAQAPSQATSRGCETPANLKQGSQDSDQLKVRATFAQESGVSRNNDGGDNG